MAWNGRGPPGPLENEWGRPAGQAGLGEGGARARWAWAAAGRGKGGGDRSSETITTYYVPGQLTDGNAYLHVFRIKIQTDKCRYALDA
jgi:hypothetical protein